eukprot:767922-Amphidinium_carterae.1
MAWLDRSWRQQGHPCQQQGHLQLMSGTGGPTGEPDKPPKVTKLTLAKAETNAPYKERNRWQPRWHSMRVLHWLQWKQYPQCAWLNRLHTRSKKAGTPPPTTQQRTGALGKHSSAGEIGPGVVEHTCTWGGRSSHWEMQEAAPATWPEWLW